ncbi:hypothetical protein J1TS3_12130 [Siminovitchia fordii]|uniref:Uncharacterized protein n=1 Tax=Siminovitchia fordii TaxID=254759 RepID=A0ABQ4K2V1_9BACI|nr:hypothetical protein J1TS3_12130 [Siminovitchia fordii]
MRIVTLELTGALVQQAKGSNYNHYLDIPQSGAIVEESEELNKFIIRHENLNPDSFSWCEIFVVKKKG